MRHSLERTYVTREITYEDIAAIMQDQPTLGAYGFGTFGQYHPEFRVDLVAELQESRDQLLSSVDQCSHICKWLSTVAKSKTINKLHTSYGLKHYVERFYEPFYCYEGSFIVAAIHSGFDWVRYGSAAYFNFDQASLSRLLVTN